MEKLSKGKQRNLEGLCYNCNAPVVPGKIRCERHLHLQNVGNRRRYIKVTEGGLCPRCGNDVKPGYTCCDSCLKGLAIERQNLRQQRLCVQCSTPIDTLGYNYCKKCREAKEEWGYAFRAKAKQEGRCSCGRMISVPGGRKCQTCHEYQAARHNKLIEEGRCSCGRMISVPGVKKCQICREYQAARHNKLIAEGKCANCGKPLMMGETTKYCRNCNSREFKFRWD